MCGLQSGLAFCMRQESEEITESSQDHTTEINSSQTVGHEPFGGQTTLSQVLHIKYLVYHIFAL